ncbi:Rop guanine nucleotide exchange factor 14-like protein isoform X1 [Tanacetum coccineum]
MTTREFWYEEAKGNYLMPQVPIDGLSDGERKKLIKQVRLVHQVFKAAKSINETMCAAWLRIQLRWKRVICQSIRTHASECRREVPKMLEANKLHFRPIFPGEECAFSLL